MSDPTPIDVELSESTETDFASFYRDHYQRIARSLTFAVGDAGLGQEAADEAMTRAVARWGQLRSTANPAGWVYRVGLNWAKSSRGKGSRLVKRIVSRPTPRIPAGIPADANPDLWQALQALDDEVRSVVVCRLVADWSTRQTAEALDIAEGTVKTRLARGLRELRETLEPTAIETQEA